MVKTYTRKDKKDLHLINDTEKRYLISLIGTSGKRLEYIMNCKGWKNSDINEQERYTEYTGIINNYRFYFSDKNRIEKIEII